MRSLRYKKANSTLRKILRLAAVFFVGVAIVWSGTARGVEENGSGAQPPATAPKPASSPAARSESALPKSDPRRDLRITLVSDKPEYFLGENVILHYRIENRGKRAFHLDHPDGENDPLFIATCWHVWDTAGRDINFYVEVLDQTGRKAEDPFANIGGGYFGSGGLGGMWGGMGSGSDFPRPELKPGGKYCEDLLLMRYREPGKAGTYTIKVYRNLGWEPAAVREAIQKHKSRDIPPVPLNAPIVTTTIRFRMPDPQQARKVVEGMMKLPTGCVLMLGEGYQPFADFSLLRYPVYLPIMRELAEKGDARGLVAIGAMAFPEATQALLDLSYNKNQAVASDVPVHLLSRLPDSTSSGLAGRSWRPDLKRRAMQLGWDLLINTDRQSRIRGNRIIGSLGGKDDLPKLIETMDKLLSALTKEYNS